MSGFGMEWAWRAPWLSALPHGWRTVRFKALAQENLQRNDDGSDGRLLSLSAYDGVVPKEYDDENRARTADELRRYFQVSPGVLVVNPMWLINRGVAVSRIAGVTSPDYRVYRLSPDIDPQFAHHLLRSDTYVDMYRVLVRGATTFDRRISKDDFHELPIPVPPLEAQRAIADFLDRKTAAIDALIEKKARLIALLQEKRQALITHAVTKGLDPNVPMKDSGIEWLGPIPAHWTTSTPARKFVPGSARMTEIVERRPELMTAWLDRELA